MPSFRGMIDICHEERIKKKSTEKYFLFYDNLNSVSTFPWYIRLMHIKVDVSFYVCYLILVLIYVFLVRFLQLLLIVKRKFLHIVIEVVEFDSNRLFMSCTGVLQYKRRVAGPDRIFYRNHGSDPEQYDPNLPLFNQY